MSSFHLASQTLTITYLANEGVMIADQDVQILVDPLFNQGYGTYLLLPEKEKEKITHAQSPYDQIDLILISHVHGDHFDPELINQHLQHNANCTIIGSSQVTDNLKAASNYKSYFDKRVITFSPDMHGDFVQYQLDDMTVRGYWIRHGNPSNYGIINLVFMLEYKDVKILHGGDAEAIVDFFSPYNFQEQEIDVALMPFWYMLDKEGKALVDKFIAPDRVVGIHVPRVFNTYVEKISTHYPDDIIFTRTGQKVEVSLK